MVPHNLGIGSPREKLCIMLSIKQCRWLAQRTGHVNVHGGVGKRFACRSTPFVRQNGKGACLKRQARQGSVGATPPVAPGKSSGNPVAVARSNATTRAKRQENGRRINACCPACRSPSRRGRSGGSALGFRQRERHNCIPTTAVPSETSHTVWHVARNAVKVRCVWVAAQTG